MPCQRIVEGIYLVGGDTLTYAGDCLCYLVAGPPLVLVDAGASLEIGRLSDNILEAGFNPRDIAHLFLTHGHVDHIGGVAALKELSGCRVAAHTDDAAAIRTGDPGRTAANWYGIELPPVTVEDELQGVSGDVAGIRWIHIPGHTPGSIAAYVDHPAGRVLFAQDVHGPFSQQFRSDKDQWRASMGKLLALEPEILCEGHYGVFNGNAAAKQFIRAQLAAHA
jgi:glyoxylase-like metal-dependent hydrolase (beta-lactamase superfamily II)